MKVILIQNVPKLGQKGDIKEVNDGYARNCLIPSQKAKPVTTGEVKNIQNLKEHKSKEGNVLINKVKVIFSQLEKKEILISEKANEKGHLFAQVHVKEIADAIGNLGFDISEDWINLEKPIKELGEFNIPLEAFKQKGSVRVKIEGK